MMLEEGHRALLCVMRAQYLTDDTRISSREPLKGKP